jgi:hypothetical protein
MSQIMRRIVFGEPKPGCAQFAAILKKLDESVSYRNTVGNHRDRVTEVPFTIPVPDFDFQQPAPLTDVSSPADPKDPWGIFSLHHMLLYDSAAAAFTDPFHRECASLCRAIYAYPGDPVEVWDHSATTAGVDWAVRFEDNRAYVVFRGSDDLLDWLRDLTSLDIGVLLAHVLHQDTFGPTWDGFVIGMSEAWAVIKPLVASSPEVIFTGHSLGAARADVAAAYALTEAGSEAA